jgi:lipopolysaccharide transport system permease protein
MFFLRNSDDAFYFLYSVRYRNWYNYWLTIWFSNDYLEMLLMPKERIKEIAINSATAGVIIAPLKGWTQLGLREVWEYRDLIWSFATRNFRVRYRQMALGPLWSILSPLIDMVILSAIFGGLAKLPSEGIPYSIFTYVALIPWGYFSGITNAAAGSLVSEMDVISKIYFPRLVIPFSNILSLLFDTGISMFILFGMVFYYHFSLSWRLLFVPAYLALAAVAGLGIGLWLATLAVRYRDVRNLAGYGLQVLKFVTPVVYTASLIPEKWQPLYRINPMYWVVEGFRWIFLGTGQAPNLMIGISAALAVILMISGMYVFQRTERTIVDWL